MPVDHVNEVELYWEQRGSGPRLLFCNGSGLTLQDVRPLLDPLTASFDLLAWDYRGFGRSAPVTRPYTMADVAADAAGLLEIAGWDAWLWRARRPVAKAGPPTRCKNCWNSRRGNGWRRN
jgi:3-oxoadipate enol-lactonase